MYYSHGGMFILPPVGVEQLCSLVPNGESTNPLGNIIFRTCGKRSIALLSPNPPEVIQNENQFAGKETLILVHLYCLNFQHTNVPIGWDNVIR